ncbi:hypothetical protein CCR85_09760 [Rhodothalassium salexigens]|uniref:ABC transporter ATP-binding protein n=1 Tax=Rhodothalassium salexigens TaxID=1086 RepID=UPI0019141D71|nr:ABC transporter ATP-binding protein [Rhodothalassium salexigens]MBK5911771.1 hypothetical protein [Rhodothalassium salexigens]MBK5920441.1 hypothetical protein [Rhodothalassium salexigens]
MTEAEAPGLALDDVALSYTRGGPSAVAGVTLDVGEGEVVCLLGPSGCGKTSCLRLAAGLERPDRGRVLVGGRVVADAADGRFVAPEKRRVGLVLQDFALFPHLTVADNLAFGIARLPADERRARVAALLDQVALAHKAEAFPHELSGGEQQRVALARALAPEPDVMLMDEPFSSLDVTLRAEVRAATLAVLARRRVPTLIVTHDPEEAMALADRLVVMRAGRVVQSGTPEAVYGHPANEFVMTFLGRTNTLICPVENGATRTPFGTVALPPAMAAGSPPSHCRVMIRGGDLRPALGDRSDGVPARVVDVRLVGPVQQVTLALPDGAGDAMMEVDRRLRVSPGETLAVAAEPGSLRCFPMDETAEPA